MPSLRKHAGPVDTLLQDARYAFRMLKKTPGFTAIAALTIALGIGANTTIFSMVDALLLEPPPGVRRPGEIVRAYRVNEEGDSWLPTSYPNYRDYRDGAGDLVELAGSFVTAGTFLGDGDPEIVMTFVVTHNFFDVLGVRPALGRFFLPQEDEDPASSVAVLSHRTWQRRFAGDSSVIGRTIKFNRHTYTVVGVTEEGFTGPVSLIEFGLWLPLGMAPTADDNVTPQSRSYPWVEMIGRRKAGTTGQQVSEALNRIAANIEAAFPDDHLDHGIDVRPYGPISGQAARPVAAFVLLLFVATGLILLIAATNVGSMLLSRASQRGREVALRIALGAGRLRMMRQLVTESVLLFVLGGAGGVLAAAWATKMLNAFQLPIDVPLVLNLSPDGSALAFSLVIALVTGVLFGLAPALHGTRVDLTSTLKSGVGDGSPSRSRLRNAFVVVQVAGSALLLVAAGLLTRSLSRAQEINIGMDPNNVHLLASELIELTYSEQEARPLYDRILERLSSLEYVEAAALVDAPPLTGPRRTARYAIPGREVVEGREPPRTHLTRVTPDYFDVLRIPVLRGRGFSEDDVAGAPAVTLINETLARREWPGEDPIGRRIILGGPGSSAFRIVGIVQNGKYTSPGEDPLPMAYIAYAQSRRHPMAIVARVTEGASNMTRVSREILHDVDRNLIMEVNGPYEEMMAMVMLPNRAGAIVTSSLGLLGLLFASLGLYGVLAYTVSQRKREIGIRIALGAAQGKVRTLILRDAAQLTGLGLGIGFAAAALITWSLRALLYGVSPVDPVTFGGIAALLIAVSLVASYLPARRATRTDPVEALRME
jgi:predicted permease